MRIEEDIKLDFKDVLIKPKRSTLKSRSEVDLEREFKFKYYPKTLKCIPVISANMDTTGTFEVAIALAKNNCMTAIHKHYSIDEWKGFMQKLKDENLEFVADFIFISIGIRDEDVNKLKELTELFPQLDKIMIDIANAYIEGFVDFCANIRKEFPNYLLAAGNLVTAEMCEQLIINGKVDICKIGIGPSAVCLTRQQAGIGMPQLSAIIECADAAHGLGGHIISDGGCKVPADLSKAFGGGADFIMIGSLFAGHDQSGGELIEENNKKYKLFYGMSSSMAMKKYAGGVAEYRSSEGRVVSVPYKGDINDTILDLLGGVRSTGTYIGARTLKEFPKRTTFIRVTEQLNTMYQQYEVKN